MLYSGALLCHVCKVLPVEFLGKMAHSVGYSRWSKWGGGHHRVFCLTSIHYFDQHPLLSRYIKSDPGNATIVLRIVLII
jgi:hypothetical protein